MTNVSNIKSTKDCIGCKVSPVMPAGPASQRAPNNLLGLLDAHQMDAPCECLGEKQIGGGGLGGQELENDLNETEKLEITIFFIQSEPKCWFLKLT